jgi:hypothetical protein
MNAYQVYRGSDGALTRRFYSELGKRGPLGVVAVNLFRAQKCSRRAKKYGPTAYRGIAYDRKGWSLKHLCDLLQEHGKEFGITFGWGRDEGEPYNKNVLYVDISEIGQVSFHSPERYSGPDYPGEWDGRRASEERIIAFCQRILTGSANIEG